MDKQRRQQDKGEKNGILTPIMRKEAHEWEPHGRMSKALEV